MVCNLKKPNPWTASLNTEKNTEKANSGFLIFLNFFGHDLITKMDGNFSLRSLVYDPIKKSQKKLRQIYQIIIDKKSYNETYCTGNYGNHQSPYMCKNDFSCKIRSWDLI